LQIISALPTSHGGFGFWLAAALWLLQFIISAFSDETIRENKHTSFFWTVRVAMIVAMVVSALVGVIAWIALVVDFNRAPRTAICRVQH